MDWYQPLNDQSIDPYSPDVLCGVEYKPIILGQGSEVGNQLYCYVLITEQLTHSGLLSTIIKIFY